jgi:FAD synthase
MTSRLTSAAVRSVWGISMASIWGTPESSIATDPLGTSQRRPGDRLHLRSPSRRHSAPRSIPPPLTKTQRKAELLGRVGRRCRRGLPHRLPDFLELSARDFFDRILVDAPRRSSHRRRPEFLLRPRSKGKRRSTPTVLCRSSLGLRSRRALRFNGQIISSSRTRQCLAEGRVEKSPPC